MTPQPSTRSDRRPQRRARRRGIVAASAVTPTALGQFYVTDPVDLTSSPNGFYGAYALARTSRTAA